MTDDFSAEALCPACGIPVTYDDEVGPEARVACPKCGTDFGSIAEVHEKALAAATKEVEDMLAKSLKDVTIKLKL